MFPISSLHTFIKSGLHVRNISDAVDGDFLLAQGRRGSSVLWISPVLVRRLHLSFQGLTFVMLLLVLPLAAVLWSRDL